MLASSPGKSPRLHSSPSSSSIHYRRASNTSSYNNPHQNTLSSPRIGSLRKSKISSQASGAAGVKTRDASTQYSPQELESHTATKDKKGKDSSKVASTPTAESAMLRQQSISEETGSQPATLVSESSSVKRTSGDASLTSNEISHQTTPKRAKAEVSRDKILPVQYEFCSTADLVVMMSSMLTDIVTINDRNQINNPHLTRFHSRVAPGISARDYLQRLATHLALQPVILLTMVFYIDRLCALYSEFSVNSLTCHRFLITAATVATKGLSDSFWNNSTYARVGGIKLSELALLELEFLHRVDWRIIPDNTTLDSYYCGLITRTDGYALAKPSPEKQPGTNETNEPGETEASFTDSKNPHSKSTSLEAESSVDAVATPVVDPIPTSSQPNCHNTAQIIPITASEKPNESNPTST